MTNLFQLYQTAPNSGWGTPELLGSEVGGYQVCVATNSDNRMEVFFIDENQAVQHAWQTVAGPAAGSFSGVQAMGFSALQIAVARNADGRLELFYIDTSNNINHCWESSPSNGPWVQSSFGGQAKQIVLTNDSEGRLQLFYIGMNDLIYTNWQTSPSTNNWDFTYINMPASRLTAAMGPNGCLQLVVTALQTKAEPNIGAGVYAFRQSAPASSVWSPGINLGTFAKDIDLVQHADGSLQLFGIATNDGIFSVAQIANSAGALVWQPVQTIGGLAQQLSICRDVDGRFELFYVGMDGYVYHLWQTQVAGPWSGGGGRAGVLASYLANTTDSNGQIVVFFLGYTSPPADSISLSTASNSNYLFYNNGRPLYSVKATLSLSSELDTGSSTNAPTGEQFSNGFSLQLNGYSPAGATVAWQQYMLEYDGTTFYGWINLWTEADLTATKPAPTINSRFLNSKVYTMSAGLDSSSFQKIPSGYQLEISLNTDPLGNVLGATFAVIDNNGKQLGSTPVDVWLQANYTDGFYAPIVAWELNLVASMDTEIVTFTGGAGTLNYNSPAVMTPIAAIPSCAALFGTTYKTGERSNVSYGTLTSTPLITTSQSVSVVTDKAKMKALVEKIGPATLVGHHPPA